MAKIKIQSYAGLDFESRCDAEHITAPVFLTSNYQAGSQVVEFTQYGTSKNLNEHGKGFSVLRLNEFEAMFIKSPEKHCDLITESTYQQLRLRKGDVLICRTNGNPNLVGKSAVVMEDTDCAYASYIFKVRPNRKILPQVLTVYLNCKYGRAEIIRHQMISIQTNFSPERFKRCHIPLFSDSFQASISGLIDKGYLFLRESKTLYSTTEEYLNKALGLDNFAPTKSLFSIKGLADSFHSSGRIDGEYYQKCFDSIERKLDTKSTVRSLCKVDDGKFIPSAGDYKYIELADVGEMGNVISCTVAPFSELPSRARRLVKKGQIIVSSIEGSLSSCALITDEYHGAICSTGFYIVESSKINPETLIVLFKSPFIQAMMKKRCSGTILTAISKSALEQMPLPEVEETIQQKIAFDIQKSFALRRQSEQLLDTAKQAVEMAIESGEDAAIVWLKHHRTQY